MRVFINYLENYGETTNTDILYPKNLTRLAEYVNIETEVNTSRLQPLIQKIIGRLKITRLTKYLSIIPHNIVLLSLKSVQKADLVYSSYIYPKYVGFGSSPPNVLRINYQTDHVLISRNVNKIVDTRRLISRRWKPFDALITTTKFSVSLIEQECPTLTKHVYYCPFFLPDLTTISSNKFRKKLSESLIKIIFVGRDGNRKGLSELVLAISNLNLKAKENIHLTVISETEFDHNLLEGIKFNYLKSAPNSQVIQLMEESHIFCLPTKSEAYGIVFVEAMSKGCAIIADNDLPRLELVRDNDCGICIDPNDTSQIKNALENLIVNSQMRSKYMENAVKVFKSEFSPEVVARKHEKIFHEIIDKK